MAQLQSRSKSNEDESGKRRKQEVEKASNLRLPDHLSKAAELAQDKGSSSWLTTLPLEEYSSSLTKSEFHDVLSLRYGWLPNHMPKLCLQ